jgi:chorismate synthase
MIFYSSISEVEFLVCHYFLEFVQIESNIVRCPDPEYAEKMISAIDAVRVKGDSVGGVVTCIVRNCPRVSLFTSLTSKNNSARK